MTPHDHREYVPGCHRCELGRDELAAALEAEWHENEPAAAYRDPLPPEPYKDYVKRGR